MDPRLLQRLWWMAIVLMAAVMAPKFMECVLSLTPEGPASPLDNTRSDLVLQWQFLAAAAPHIPTGESFTVEARSTEDELSLGMMALGLLPAARLQPSSYYGVATSAGDTARYVLVYGRGSACDEPDSDLVLIARVVGGLLYERR